MDEYQDTSVAQFRLVSLLTGPEKNICVVGDDDQSIYRFRGATIENILNFEHIYPNTKTIRLEQNYRSTSNILNAANCVIQHNTERKGKTLWTSNGEGDKVQVYTAENEQDEASHIADVIGQHLKEGGHLADHAILYRMNASIGPHRKLLYPCRHPPQDRGRPALQRPQRDQGYPFVHVHRGEPPR